MQASRSNANIPFGPHMNVKYEVLTKADRCIAKQSSETVYLIDDELRVHESLSHLFAALEVKMVSFESAGDYLEYGQRGDPSCLIIDMQLPGINTDDLQQRKGRGINPPIIFISEHTDIPATVRAMRAGAISILAKPVNPAALAEAVNEAFAQNRKRRLRMAELEKLQQRFFLLTPREREVVPLLVGGLLNKQAAFILGISVITLQVHRSQVMRKMEAKSFADLVRMALQLRIPYWHPDNPCTGSAMQAIAIAR
jgi:FixJ family two-component response regulator